MQSTLWLMGLISMTGCKTGLLEAGSWGTLRYFGELTGVPYVNWDPDAEGDLLLEVLPPVSDRDGNVYVLYEDPDGDSVVYVGQAHGGWSRGCQAGEQELPHTPAEQSHLHGFLGTTDDAAWYWAGDALVEVSGTTGQCTQLLDTDPLTVTDLQVVAALPMVYETPARRTLTAWVQGVSDASRRLAPYQVVVDLDLGRYVAYDRVEPSDGTCFDVIGVGGSTAENEGVVVVAYNRDGERVVEARIIDTHGVTERIITLEMDSSTFYNCEEDDTTRSEPLVLGFLQRNDQGVYAGLLDDGDLLAFNNQGGTTRDLPDFEVAGLVRHDGDLWVSGTADNRPVVAKLLPSGQVENVVRWKTSETAARALQGKIDVLDQRFQPAEPGSWRSPVTAIGTWPFITPFPIDRYATGTTGWLVAGPSFESTLTRTAVAFGPVGIAVP